MGNNSGIMESGRGDRDIRNTALLSAADFAFLISSESIPGMETGIVRGIAEGITVAQGITTIFDAASPTNTSYTYLTADTTLYLSSSSAADTQLVLIDGLDITLARVQQTKNLTGQTPVAITTDLFRVFEIRNVGTAEFAGDVYLSSDNAATAGVPDVENTIKAKAVIGREISNNTMFTVPLDCDFYFLNVRALVGKNHAAIIESRIRLPGSSIFFAAGTFPVYQTPFESTFIAKFRVPTGTDIEYRAKAIDTSVDVYMAFEHWLDIQSLSQPWRNNL